ncbi:MAG: hypothetical protein AAB719_01490 [Patescibacteria group bacterium]
MKKNGYSLVEFVFAVVMATVIVFIVTIFAKNAINFNSSSQSSMNAIFESRKILSTMVSELRSTAPSAMGSYSIESAATSSIVFFADVNSDDISDRIRYFLDPNTRAVQRGVILATGEPPGYTVAETFSTIVSDIGNGASTALFDYYDGNYAGTTSPLSIPVNIASIRMVKITIKVERDPNKPSELMTFSSQASLRNLKDNL